jgi:hypothetical protein
MIVISVDSSHQMSTSNRPRVAAQLVTNATTIARLIRVIIPGCRARSSGTAPRRNTIPPYPKITVPISAGIRSLPGNSGASYPSHSWRSSLQSRTGIVSSKETRNRSRNIATEWPACRSGCT